MARTLQLETRDETYTWYAGLKADSRTKAPPWKYMRMGSFFSFEGFGGRKRRTERLEFESMVMSLDATPVTVSSPADTNVVPTRRSMLPFFRILKKGEKSWRISLLESMRKKGVERV